MTGQSMPVLAPALPEIFLAIGAMALLMLGVFKTRNIFRSVSWFTVFIFAACAVLVLATGGKNATTFGGMFVTDGFAVFVKILILAGSAAAIVLALPFLEKSKLDQFEYPVLIALATLGMMMMVSANDMLALYMGLELQSLCLYVLAAINRDRQRSTEAGLKYFVLGALSSGMLLYGISLVYGFTGTTSFEGLATQFAEGSASTGVLVGMVFILAGLSFKISAVPFHMWTPDVYEGAPTPVTAFFAAAPKVAAFALLLRVAYGAFPDLTDAWRQIIVLISILSMFLGALAAIQQTNIKRLMAYSSIGHVGYALVGVAAGTQEGVEGVLVYLAIYLTMTLGTFACILSMRRKDGMVEDIYDLGGLAQTRPRLAFAIATFMFSLAGIPLLAGFFGKLYIFLAAIHAGLYELAAVGVVASVIGAFYYLRIVKVLYFDDPEPEFVPQEDRPTRIVLGATVVVNSPVSLILISPLTVAAAAAAASLFS